MFTVDTLVLLILFYLPLAFIFLKISEFEYRNIVWLFAWSVIAGYIIYKSFDYVSDLIILSVFMGGFGVTNVYGLKLFIDQSMGEITGVPSPVPYRFTKKAVDETCRELKTKWYCLRRRGGSLIFDKAKVIMRVERLKRGIIVGVEGKPTSATYYVPLTLGLLYTIYVIFVEFIYRETTILLFGYPMYLPIFGLLFSLLIGLYLLSYRKNVFEAMTISMLALRKKLEKSKEVYDMLRAIAVAERIKEEERRRKIKQAAELAKALAIAEKIAARKSEEEVGGEGEAEEEKEEKGTEEG